MDRIIESSLGDSGTIRALKKLLLYTRSSLEGKAEPADYVHKHKREHLQSEFPCQACAIDSCSATLFGNAAYPFSPLRPPSQPRHTLILVKASPLRTCHPVDGLIVSTHGTRQDHTQQSWLSKGRTLDTPRARCGPIHYSSPMNTTVVIFWRTRIAHLLPVSKEPAATTTATREVMVGDASHDGLMSNR